MLQQVNYYYPLKVWSTTLTIGALLFCLYGAFFSTNHSVLNEAWLMVYLLAVIVGAMYSLPALGMFYLLFSLLQREQLPSFVLKMLMALLNSLSILATIYIIKPSTYQFAWNSIDVMFVLCYIVPLISSVMLYKVTKKKTSA